MIAFLAMKTGWTYHYIYSLPHSGFLTIVSDIIEVELPEKEKKKRKKSSRVDIERFNSLLPNA